MDDIIDLTDAGADHEVITETSTGGLLGGTILNDEPVEAYLDGDEEPKYVLRNKKSGVEIERDGDTESIAPASDYQALAVVTDVRILFVVGQDDGNETKSLALEDVFEARTGSGGFRTAALEIEDLDGEVWTFPIKTDPSAVAEAVDAWAQDWVSAARLLDDAEAELDEAGSKLPADSAGAGTVLDEAVNNLKLASDRVQSVGPGAREQVTDRAKTIADRLFPIRRRQQAELGASAQARTHDAWAAGNFEAAAEAVETAVDAFETALDTDGETPGEDLLRKRLQSVRAERELLRVAPRFEADANRRRAVVADDPETAAEFWEQTLGGYRQLLSIDWPAAERAFVIDETTLREQVSAVADDAVADYYEAGKNHLRMGDLQEAPVARNEAYEQAQAQFEQAKRLVSEVNPSLLDTIETALFTVERRLDGNVPEDPEEPVVPELEFEPPEGAEEEDESPAEASPNTRRRQTGRTGHDTASVPDQGPVSGQDDPRSPIDQIKSQKVEEGEPDGDSTGTTAPAATGLHAQLRSLDEEPFTEFVADLWETAGWSTTVFSATPDAVYDIMAIRDSPEEERLLLWTVHRTDGGDIGSTVVKRCATARDSSQGTDTVALVTTGSLTTTAERRAVEMDVTAVDCDSLVDRIRSAGYEEKLEALAESE